MKLIIGEKMNMTQRFTERGVLPITVVSAGPCTVTQVKGAADGYTALQLAYKKTDQKQSSPKTGHVKGLGAFRFLKEFRVSEAEIASTQVARGSVISVGQFKPGDIVHVTGMSKGKGFQGVVKRHGFSGSPKTHGHKDQLRMPGSIGAGGVQRVFKGTRMGGRMGGARVTTTNLTVVDVDIEKNLLFIKGAVPGARKSLLLISGPGDFVLDAVPATSAAADEMRAEPVEAPEVHKAEDGNEEKQ